MKTKSFSSVSQLDLTNKTCLQATSATFCESINIYGLVKPYGLLIEILKAVTANAINETYTIQQETEFCEQYKQWFQFEWENQRIVLDGALCFACDLLVDCLNVVKTMNPRWRKTTPTKNTTTMWH